MKVYGIQILVDDIAAARRFYAETLGLPVEWDLPDFGAFGVKADPVLFIVTTHTQGNPPSAAPGRFLGVSIGVEDIEAAYRDLSAKGVPFEGAPEKQPWGGTLAHFRDPSGNILTLLG
jgi:catechol 2,3-dioxygenase-like lactoylglutathione lyase family enzyme